MLKKKTKKKKEKLAQVKQMSYFKKIEDELFVFELNTCSLIKINDKFVLTYNKVLYLGRKYNKIPIYLDESINIL